MYSFDSMRSLTTLFLCLTIALLTATAIGQHQPVATLHVLPKVKVIQFRSDVPLETFHKAVPAVTLIDKKLTREGFRALPGPKNTVGRAFEFEVPGEKGEVRVFGKKYVQSGSNDLIAVVRIGISSTSRSFVTTAALRSSGGTGKYMVSFVEKDPIDPTHGRPNPETAGGCFDCPNPPGFPGCCIPAPGGTWDPTFWNCPRAVLDVVVDCVFSDNLLQCGATLAGIAAWC